MQFKPINAGSRLEFGLDITIGLNHPHGEAIGNIDAPSPGNEVWHILGHEDEPCLLVERITENKISPAIGRRTPAILGGELAKPQTPQLVGGFAFQDSRPFNLEDGIPLDEDRPVASVVTDDLVIAIEKRQPGQWHVQGCRLAVVRIPGILKSAVVEQNAWHRRSLDALGWLHLWWQVGFVPWQATGKAAAHGSDFRDLDRWCRQQGINEPRRQSRFNRAAEPGCVVHVPWWRQRNGHAATLHRDHGMLAAVGEGSPANGPGTRISKAQHGARQGIPMTSASLQDQGENVGAALSAKHLGAAYVEALLRQSAQDDIVRRAQELRRLGIENVGGRIGLC